MQYFPDILAMTFLFPSGLIYGYYLKIILYFPNSLWFHWYALTGIICSIFFAIFMTVKKSKDQLYRFDHFYIMFHGLICFFVSGIFLWKSDFQNSFFFGFAGCGIVVTPCYTYISIRSSKSGYRPARIALANSIYFIGIATGYNILYIETWSGYFQNTNDSSWTLIGTTIILAIGLAVNEIMQLTHGYNYKKSRDNEWNQNNILKLLFLNQHKILEYYQRSNNNFGQFLIAKSKLKTSVIGIFLTIFGRIMIFSFILLILSEKATLKKNININLNLILLGCGSLFGSFLLLWFRSKLIYLVFGLIKISSVIGILGTFNLDKLENMAIFFWIYFITLGIISSITLQGLLEISPFKYTEMIFSFGYCCEMFFIELLKYELKKPLNSNDEIWYLILIEIIIFVIISLICIILIQLYLPKSKSLIEIRNLLIGLRRGNFIPTSKVWYSNWFLRRNQHGNNNSTEINQYQIHY